MSEIDQEKVIEKYEKKLKELNSELKELLQEDSHMKLKLDRLTLK